MLRRLFLFFLGCAALAACRSGSDAPDVSNVKARLEARRFDRDLYALDTGRLGAGLAALQPKYPDFLNFYLDTLMGFGVQGRYDDASGPVREGVRVLLTQHDYRGVFDSVAAHFPDTKAVEDALLRGYRYYRHYLPEAPEVKKVIFFSANLNRYAAITYGDLLGIGLDMYLGPQYPFYRSVEIPDYVIRRLKPEYIPVDAFIALHRDRHPFEPENRSLLDLMVQRGQEQVFLEKVLPETADTLRLGLSKAQLDWCRDNEAQLFNYFASNKLLYETSTLKVLRYVSDGPPPVGLPQEAPGNVGTYLGYHIVKAWLDRHADLPLAQVLQPQDASRLLQESGYKPR